jgi:hypothetical protein
MVFYIIKNGVILVGDDRNYIVIVFSKVYSSLCFFSMVVSVGFETIFFLSYVCFNLIPRRSKERIDKTKFCRILFMRLFGGYGSIVISIIFGFFMFLNVDHPAIAFLAPQVM